MLTLIDGNSLLFRAYYGVHSRLTRRDGTPTGAVYGFINMILPVLATAQPNDAFVCVFDASRRTFRQDIYPEYKANRAETPADLITQSYMVRNALTAMGLSVLCIPGVEADDVIATLATANCNNSGGTRIITSDKDLMQLVSDCVFLYDGMKSRAVRQEQVFEKFGVKPSQVIDVQALMGDSSDNVPGVRGIGPKKAAELIREFETLDNLYAHLDNIKNDRIRNLLASGRDSAYLSRRLVTLKTDVDLSDLIIEPFQFNTPSALHYVKNELESNSLALKIEKMFPLSSYNPITQPDDTPYARSQCEVIETNNDAPQNIKDRTLSIAKCPQMTFVTITTTEQLADFLSHVTDILALDTETTGLNHTSARLVGISIAYDASHGAYIPLRHCKATDDLFKTENIVPNQLPIDIVYKKLWPILINPKIVKIGHNLKYDFHVLENEGWNTDLIRPIDDTMLLSYALHGTLHTHGLDELALRYLGHENIHFSSLFDSKIKDSERRFDTLSLDIATPYSAEDATVCRALYDIMRPQLDSDDTLHKLYETCDLPLMPILMHIERNGVLLDKAKLHQLSGIFHNQLAKLECEIWDIVGHEFNIASPKQLANVLFEELRLPANKKHSTDAETLNEIIDSHPVIEKILNWRSVAKLAGTYADSLPKQTESDGRIHTTYLQTSTNTGRLSSRDPNLQNIPIKTELGNEIRQCFIARPNNVLISVDYSQIQLRLLADVAGVKTFADTFHNNTDIHEQTARQIFNILPGQPVPKDLRRAAKTVNFSIIYGISAFGLAGQLGVSRAEAQKIIDTYMTGLPEIEDYINQTKDFVLSNGFVLTPWGRRIWLPEVKNPRTRAYALRAAINAPIQGFEADIMRRAMINIDRNIIQPNSDKIRIIMQVHDEIIFECDSALAENFAQNIKAAMETVTQLSVPLIAEFNIAKYWSH